MKKQKLPFKENIGVKFIEESHTYVHELDPNLVYDSVTKFLNESKEFDSKKIAKELAENPNSKYYGNSAEQILEMWDSIQKNGTQFHKRSENLLNGKKDKELEQFYKKSDAWFLFENKQYTWSEVRLVFHRLRLAGTSDIIFYNKEKDVYEVYDIKTSTSINPDKLYSYSLQIQLYAAMLMTMGLPRAEPGGIIWIKNNDKDSLYFNDLSKLEAKLLKPIDCKSFLKSLLIERKKKIDKILQNNESIF